MRLNELAGALRLELRGDGELEIVAPAPVEAAGSAMITFLANPRYLTTVQQMNPACVIVSAELADKLSCAVLLSHNPTVDFARTLNLFYPPYRPPIGIDPSARIAASAQIGEGASIGAHVVIGEFAKVGPGAVIHPNVTIYPNVQIGVDFVCHSNVTIREAVIIGDRVILHAGAVIGADGFGFVEVDGDLAKIPQVGNVVLESDVEVGANSTIDRATMGSTMIRRGVKLDNLVHIGHNCEVGSFSRFAAQAGIAGSVKIGEWCEFGGQTGTADHLRIGKRVRVAAKSGVPNDVADSQTVSGIPSVEIRLFRRYVAALHRLPGLFERIRAMEQKLGLSRHKEREE